MVKLTLIYRLHDGLPLAESLDNVEIDGEMNTAKRLAKVSPLRCALSFVLYRAGTARGGDERDRAARRRLPTLRAAVAPP